jgi:hypothetical protein
LIVCFGSLRKSWLKAIFKRQLYGVLSQKFRR